MKSLSLQSPVLLTLLFLSVSFTAKSQNMEKVSFDSSDSSNGYYLAFPPASNSIKGALIFFCPFRGPESLLPETRLHSVAAASNLLTVYASLGRQFTANPSTIDRINAILRHVTGKYRLDTAKVVLGGFYVAGSIVLRYTEMAYEHPEQSALRPAAVFAVASPVDLSEFYRTNERQIKKNYFPPAVGDARLFLDLLTKDQGALTDHPDHYRQLSPLNHADPAPGNEQFLRSIPVRLYYDTDISWQLNRGNSLYDTDIPDGTELIDRLRLAGNKRAEFIPAKLPGVKSSGARNAVAMSIFDETDGVQWINGLLRIFDPNNPLGWVTPYKWGVPDGWTVEHATLPSAFSAHVHLNGMEDIRFPPGWGNAGSEEYWSVAYLFWLDGGQHIDADVLQRNLTIYYDDLIANGVDKRTLNLPAGNVFPTQVTIKKIKPDADDLETYTGTIHLFDYLGKTPITLNFFAHLKSCTAQNHIPLFLEISPKPFDHPLWTQLRQIKQKFACEP